MNRPQLCGVAVDPLELDELLDRAIQLCQQPSPSYICYLNAHVHNLARRDERLRKVINASAICYADGASVVWGCRRHGIALPGRLTGADFLPTLLGRCRDEQIGVFLLGGRPGVAQRASRRLQEQVAGWSPVGLHHGFFDDSDSASVVDTIRAKQPQLLLVGMGTPRQEYWVADHLASLNVPLVWSVGALLDYSAGMERRCPSWMGQSGLEWVFRLAMQPRRMAARYLLGNPRFVWSVLTQRPAV